MLRPKSRTKLPWKHVLFLAGFFASRNVFMKYLKAICYQLGLDVCLQHDNFWRDPDDCPECMTNEEWKKSKFRHLGRMGPDDEYAEENRKEGIPVPVEGCYTCILEGHVLPEVRL